MTPKSLIAPARLARRPVLATQTDARLVDLVRAGYDPAFEAIVARYRGPLLRYAERFLSRERAEDAVQQSFVKAYEAMLRDDAALNLRPWLYRIAHNTALNTLRDRGLRHESLDESIDGVERPEQALERSQGVHELVAAVQALPERQRDAIVLRELEGRTYEEIAAQLGVTDGSVRQLLNRARNTLRAGATAVIPLDLVLRIPLAAQSEPIAARVAELCGAAGAGAAFTKVGATAAVTATLVGGAVVAPDRIQTDSNAPPAAAAERPDRRAADLPPPPAQPAGREDGEPERVALAGEAGRDEGSVERSGSDARGGGDSSGSGGSGGDEDSADAGGDRSGHSGGGHDRSNRGRGGGDGDDDEDRPRGKSRQGNSGPGGGDDDEEDHGGDDDHDEAEEEAAKLLRDDSDEDDSGPGGGGDSGSGDGDSAGSDDGGDSSGSGSGSSGDGDVQDAGDALYESSSGSGGSGGSGG